MKEKWSLVRDALKNEIATGVYQPGDKLPTEPELASKYGTGRHSVRRAVAELSREGTLSVEQGRGTFVETGPMLEYAIGTRTRLRESLSARSVDVSGDLLGANIVKSTETVAAALNILPGDSVIENQRITFAGDLPIAFGTSYHSADRFPDFATRRDVLGSTTETYKTYGITDYVRAETTLHSRLARPDEAKRLKQHLQSPVMVICAVDTMLDGTPLSYKKVIWSAIRVRFTISKDED